MKWNPDVRGEAAAVQAEYLELIEALCAIPAPLNGEQKRARFILRWLEEQHLPGVVTDGAGNVIFPYHCCDEKYIAFTAHMDTVFSEKSPFTVQYAGTIARCPGIGDDTVHLAALLLLARWAVRSGIRFTHPILFVWDTGEEGLGDLRGVRRLMEEYEGRVAALVALDAVYPHLICQAVGSVRYRITIETEGGHSFRNFGSPNAIERMAALIAELYHQELPPVEGARTTFNVGTIRGGTSVNTIAQRAEMLYEYRSDSPAALEAMEKQLRALLEEQKKHCLRLDCREIGRRPAGTVSSSAQTALEQHWRDAAEELLPGVEIRTSAGSTDCNIPLAQGIPAICIGGYRGGGAHTREEWIDCDSLETGYALLLRFLLSFRES